MATLNVVYRVGADIRELQSKMNQAAQATSGLSTTLDSVGSKAKKAGTVLSLALTAPMVAAGAAAIRMGMDAVESENLFEVSFGKMADSARRWSEQLSESLGLNQFELRRTSATLFTMFESMKIGEEAAFGMATGLTELAQDMASFFNLRPEEAFEKLRAGIVGETEPLKRLGILVDEATTKVAAMRFGIIEQGQTMTQQQKVFARYLSIMEQTSAAQGDLARTIDSPTNQLRVLRSQVEELAIKLGIALLPVFESVLGAIRSVVPGIQSLVNSFTSLSPKTQQTIVVITSLVAALGPALVVFGVLASSVAAVIPVLAKLAAVFHVVAAAQFGTTIGPGILVILTAIASVKLGRVIGELELFSGKLKTLTEVFEFGGAKALMWLGVIDDVDSETLKLAISSRRLLDQQTEQVSATESVSDVMGSLADSLSTVDMILESSSSKSRDLTTEMRSMDKQIELTSQSGLKMLGAFTSNFQALGDVEQGAADARGSMFAFGLIVEETLVGVEDLNAGIQNIGRTLERETPPTFFDSLRSQLNLAITGVFEGLPNVIVGAFQGGGNIGRSIGSFIGGDIGSGIGTQVTKAIGGNIGELVGGFLGPLGAIGGGLFGKLFSIGGPSEAELAAREMVDTFTSSVVAQLSAGQFEEAQRALAAGWKNANDAALVIGVRDAAVAMGNTAEQAVSAVQRLWDSIREGPEATQVAIDAIDKLTGGTIDLSQITSQQFDEMRAAADRYGIDLEDLGDRFLSAELSKSAHQIIRDFELLTAGGADVGAVLEGMSDEVSNLVQDSLRFGLEIPANMKPVINSLIEQGLLVDKNGDKFKSLEGLRFAETLTQGFDRVADGLDNVTGRLEDIVRLLSNDIPRAVPSLSVPVSFDVGPLRLPSVPNFNIPQFQHGTGGEFVDFGPGTLAMLHGRERVMTEGESAGSGPTVVNIDARGALLTDDFASGRALTRLIDDAVVGDLELSRRLR